MRHRKEDQGEIRHNDSLHRGILNYVHTDVWGPIKTASIVGNHIIFIDDYSRRCWVYTIKYKGEVLELFVE